MQIASTINFPAERIRCLANVEKGYRCTNKGTVNVKKFYSTKSTTDKIMDCLCGIHKYHLERTPEIICERYQQLLNASLPQPLKIDVDQAVKHSAAYQATPKVAVKAVPHPIPTASRSNNNMQPLETTNQDRVSNVYDQQLHGNAAPRIVQAPTMDPLVDQLKKFSFANSIPPISAPPTQPNFVPPQPAHKSSRRTVEGFIPSIHSHPGHAGQGRQIYQAPPLQTHGSSPTTTRGRRPSRTRSRPTRLSQPLSSNRNQVHVASASSTPKGQSKGAGHLLYRSHANLERAFWQASGRNQSARKATSGLTPGQKNMSQKEHEIRLIGRHMEHLFQLYDVLADDAALRG
ncbi:MAG: hypothetical protein LQ337_004405 [Flavoplaca oasis]|nr:MAG: hypothetical protein LQ337_004405 [Flavoplaca oasis]